MGGGGGGGGVGEGGQAVELGQCEIHLAFIWFTNSHSSGVVKF